IFYSTLNPKGRAGFVMASSAGDARGSELDIRRELLKSGAVDVMVSVGPNFFYTVTLPCTLWFLDRGKSKSSHKDKVLFINARHIFSRLIGRIGISLQSRSSSSQILSGCIVAKPS